MLAEIHNCFSTTWYGTGVVLYEGGSLVKQICRKMARNSPEVYEDCHSKEIVKVHIVSVGQGLIDHLHSDLGFCITFSTLSVATKIAPLVSRGVSVCLCFRALAQLHEDRSGFIHTPHPEEVVWQLQLTDIPRSRSTDAR